MFTDLSFSSFNQRVEIDRTEDDEEYKDQQKKSFSFSSNRFDLFSLKLDLRDGLIDRDEKIFSYIYQSVLTRLIAKLMHE